MLYVDWARGVHFLGKNLGKSTLIEMNSSFPIINKIAFSLDCTIYCIHNVYLLYLFFFKFWIKRPTDRDIVDTTFRSSSLVHSFFHSVSFILILRLAEFSLCILTFKGASRFGHFFCRLSHCWTRRLEKNHLLNSVLDRLLLMFKGSTESRVTLSPLSPTNSNQTLLSTLSISRTILKVWTMSNWIHLSFRLSIRSSFNLSS